MSTPKEMYFTAMDFVEHNGEPGTSAAETQLNSIRAYVEELEVPDWWGGGGGSITITRV